MAGRRAADRDEQTGPAAPEHPPHGRLRLFLAVLQRLLPGRGTGRAAAGNRRPSRASTTVDAAGHLTTAAGPGGPSGGGGPRGGGSGDPQLPQGGGGGGTQLPQGGGGGGGGGSWLDGLSL